MSFKEYKNLDYAALADEIQLGDFTYYPAKMRLVFQGNEQKLKINNPLLTITHAKMNRV